MYASKYAHAHNLTHITAQLITQPPESATVALNTNATFSCSGNGEVLWEIINTQIIAPDQVQQFSGMKVFVPLPKPSFSELIVTATVDNNGTQMIKCLVDPGLAVGNLEESDTVQLLVFGKYVLRIVMTIMSL